MADHTNKVHFKQNAILHRAFSRVVAMQLHYGDMTDSTCLVKIIAEVKPTEIYNLAAQSHVKVRYRSMIQHDSSLADNFLVK